MSLGAQNVTVVLPYTPALVGGAAPFTKNIVSFSPNFSFNCIDT